MVRAVVAVPVALAVVLGLSACADPEPEASAPSAPALATSYTYSLASSCGERGFIGTFSVTVEDGRVTAVEGLDEPGGRAADMPGVLDDAPSIEELTARAAAEHPSEVGYDATGLLTKVSFDPDPQAIDDEECYVLSGYTPAS
ncbi:DUF6174 domain-containing protein [Cellulomonas sp. URHD0024]|uniref:DUF6174 domain-containing protein n=1 Tax=Cellulomonas sp. URHD0024 TaxID=1302620 RepID=UPI0003FE8657|nr:DUF6174 domain-containing protein [Cellulomonas sp. URHD0024]